MARAFQTVGTFVISRNGQIDDLPERSQSYDPLGVKNAI